MLNMQVYVPESSSWELLDLDLYIPPSMAISVGEVKTQLRTQLRLVGKLRSPNGLQADPDPDSCRRAEAVILLRTPAQVSECEKQDHLFQRLKGLKQPAALDDDSKSLAHAGIHPGATIHVLYNRSDKLSPTEWAKLRPPSAPVKQRLPMQMVLEVGSEQVGRVFKPAFEWRATTTSSLFALETQNFLNS
jgi:hypothetical protein